MAAKKAIVDEQRIGGVAVNEAVAAPTPEMEVVLDNVLVVLLTGIFAAVQSIAPGNSGGYNIQWCREQANRVCTYEG